jgi:hypothetical protein
MLAFCRGLGILPAVATEILLEGGKLGIYLSQGPDVRLLTDFVEPPVHNGYLFAHLLLKLVPRHLIVLDPSSGHTAERNSSPARSTSRPSHSSGFSKAMAAKAPMSSTFICWSGLSGSSG